MIDLLITMDDDGDDEENHFSPMWNSLLECMGELKTRINDIQYERSELLSSRSSERTTKQKRLNNIVLNNPDKGTGVIIMNKSDYIHIYIHTYIHTYVNRPLPMGAFQGQLPPSNHPGGGHPSQ